MSSDPYFQFPIAALHFDFPITEVTHADMEQRLREIVRYCVMEVGRSIMTTKSDETIDAMVDRQIVAQGLDAGNVTKLDQILLCGACQLHVQLSELNWDKVFSAHAQIVKKAKYHGSTLCRLKSQYLWEAIEDETRTWRDLSTLCAIYAGIGRYRRAKLTYDRIGAMAMGFNGQRERDVNNSKVHQLTGKQTLRTVARLRERGYFVSASPNRRHVFYTHRMSLEELIEDLAVTSSKAKPTASSVTEAIKRRRAEIDAKAAAKVAS